MLKLEIFETHHAGDLALHLDAETAEKLRDAAYEQGYSAGWQDALNQMRDEDAQRRVATFDAFQALTFTYAEARAMAEAQFASIVADFLRRIVPETCVHSLPGRVAQEVRVLLARDMTAPLQVLCAPDSVQLLSPVLADLPGHAMVSLVPEQSYNAAQVTVQGCGQVRSVDLSAVIADLQQALEPQPTLNSTPNSRPLRGAHHG